MDQLIAEEYMASFSDVNGMHEKGRWAILVILQLALDLVDMIMLVQ
jgi:hypothetical protein